MAAIIIIKKKQCREIVLVRFNQFCSFGRLQFSGSQFSRQLNGLNSKNLPLDFL